MTPDEINTRLAKWAGWTPDDPSTEVPCWFGPNGEIELDPPKYTEDLNAIHGLEAKLTDEQWHAYSIVLSGSLWLPENSRGWQDWMDTRSLLKASALQRATALFRALGLGGETC